MLHTQLRSFHAVAVNGGFTAASRILNVGQPTLTTQVKALEERYKVELFHRAGKTVTMTETGEELFKYTARIFQLETETEELLKSYGSMRTGKIRIAAVGPFHATDMIAAFKTVHPLIDISVQLGNSQRSSERLIDYTADVGVIAEIDGDERVIMAPYSTHNVVLFVDADHPFFQRKSVSIKELQHQKFVLREKGSTTRTVLEKALTERNVEIDPVLEIGSREAVWKAVEQGLGISAAADFEFVPHPRLRVVPFDDITITTQYFLAYLRERQESLLVRSFVDVALNVARSSAHASKRLPRQRRGLDHEIDADQNRHAAGQPD